MHKPMARAIVAVALLGTLLGVVGVARAQQVVCQTAGVAVACVAAPEHGMVVVVSTINGNMYGAVWYCDASGDHLTYQLGRPSTADDARLRNVPGPCLVGG